MGTKFCCRSVVIHSSDKTTVSLSGKRISRRSWRQSSRVYPAPPKARSQDQLKRQGDISTNEQRELFGSFRSRASLRIFTKRTTTETNLDCIVEDYSRTQQVTLDKQVLQKYRVNRIIGNGNFSRVLKVQDKLTNFEYAMKIVEKTINSHILCDRELEILKKVHHPNVVHLYEAHTTGTKVYLVLELASGGDLATRLKEVGTFSEDSTRTVLSMILSALEYLHRHGVTHRDIKLENCLFKTKDADSVILLSDFGLAYMQTDDNEKEAMQTTCGTEDYISPEMLNGDLYTDAIDMWALGVIFYAMLSGSMPFKDENRARMYQRIKDGAYSLPNEVRSSVSLQAADFMSHLLCIDPEERSSAVVAQQHSWIMNNF